jgi:hypothetical protein
LKAALMPVFKGMDLVSSSPLVPARVVQSFKAGVQDAGGVANYFKKQAVGDGNVIQNVADGALSSARSPSPVSPWTWL